MHRLTGDPVPTTPYPFRLVLRQMSEMLFAQIERARRLVPYPPVARMAGLVVLAGSVAHLPYRRGGSAGDWIGIDAAGACGRPVSATAVATSMNLPSTTVRRQITTLVEAGLLRREKAGLLVTPDRLADAAFGAVVEAHAAGLFATLRVLQHDYAVAAATLAAGIERLPAAVIARLLATLELRIMENSVDRHGDLVFAFIHAATIVANVQHITRDPVLARRFAAEDQPPPDAMREPISTRALAQGIDLPFETVRRRVASLVARGEIDATPAGLIVPTRVLTSDRHMQQVRHEVRMFEHMLHTLANLARTSTPVADRK